MKFLNLFRRQTREREMDAEMRFHIDMEAAELERMGVDAAEARRRALATFGGVQRFKEEGHEARAGSWAEDLARDLRYSMRSLARSPGYTAVVVLTLALGIAANTSIFSVAKGILFKPLPYRDPARLMVVWDGLDWIGVPEAWVTGPELQLLRRETKNFEGFSAIRAGAIAIGGDASADPQQLRFTRASSNFFQLLGAGPFMGRGFAPGEDAPGAAPVAVLSHKLWKQRFGSDADVIGKTIQLDGEVHTVIGVLPPDFNFSAQSSLGSPSGADVFLPLQVNLDSMPPDNHSLGVLARVRHDVPVAVGLAELDGISRRLDEERFRKQGFKFKPVLLQERMVRDVRPALVVLLSAIGILILIMAANLAVLALVRAARREREITVRRAIGAAQNRIVRQILTETIVLSLAGGVLGTMLGVWTLRALLALAPAGLPRRDEIGIDFGVVGVTLLVAMVIGVLMGLAPALRAARGDISTVLREKAPSHSGGRIRRVMVLAQLALSMILLAGAGLLLGSFMKLMRVDPGFSPDHVLGVEIMASRGRYPTGAPVVNIFERYQQQLAQLPGVVSVGATGSPPLSGVADQIGIRFPGSPTNTGEPNHDRMLADFGPATPGYFTTMGIPIIAGRELDASDRTGGPNTAVIDDVIARYYWPKGSAIGQVMLMDGDSARVVGVVKHIRLYGLQEEGRGQVYAAHAQQAYRWMVISLRTTGDPMSLAAAARRAIRTVDAQQPIVSIESMNDAVKRSLGERRLVLVLVAGFAAAALLLAALGVYGVTANTVTQRTRELGIRMALGADRRSVVWSVLGEPARLVGLGLLVGLAGTFAARRVVQRVLYEVSPTDPVTLGVVALVLLLVALLASYFPARRATRVDPMVALRSD